MSLDTWKAEFYPISAAVIKDASVAELIQHSLTKWIGLRPENLAKHNCRIDRGTVCDADSNRFDVAAFTCSLCQATNFDCDRCWLNASLGEPCDADYQTSPYAVFCNTGDPQPMIDALKQTMMDHTKNA